MTLTNQLIESFRSHIPQCQVTKAYALEKKILAGYSYIELGGKKIRNTPNLIRFKLGRRFRFIWFVADDGLKPVMITTRQQFDNKIKRLHRNHQQNKAIKMSKKIQPQDNASNAKNPNHRTSGTNRQYDQGQGNRGKQLNPNQSKKK
ncbi:ParE family toxin-like protein [Agarivorans sp. MS3-6]